MLSHGAQMTRSHLIQLDPTEAQRRYCRQACGTSRFVYNWALAEWNRRYEAGEKKIKANDLKKQFNAGKYAEFPWLRGVHRDAHSQPFAAVQKAYANFFAGRAKHPRFHKKGQRDSFYVANDKLKCEGGAVRLPVIGLVRMTETLRFDGKVMSATVSERAGRWFIAVSVEMPDAPVASNNGAAIGIDLGLATFATLSTGEKIEAPRPLRRLGKKLACVSRQHSRKVKGSSNRRKSALKLARLHYRISCIRKDFLHKLSTRLSKNHARIGLETLNVRGMMANRCLAKAISDQGWSEFGRMLEYKAEQYGSTVERVGMFYPSSKTCSVCGTAVKHMPLSVRTWTCGECGAAHDRDVNAAQNLVRAASPDIKPVDRRRQARRDEAGTLKGAHLSAQER